ncbi:dihydrodipicolinate synthase family protein [Arachidicoccus sp.]|uniref:dihydrodipicolinate synthase family protein n=1 Tax=Arachidicoccus sp. TaxID=1872624 RepID=UPI003D25553E
MKIQWSGVFPAITTKFNQNDELDLKMFEKSLAAQEAGGVKGIIIGGSLGESSTISNEEKEKLVRFAVSYFKERLPVIVNVAEGATKDGVALAIAAKSWGASGLMLLPPSRYKSTAEETVTYFRTIAGATDLPILLYNNPIDYKTEITIDMFTQMVDLPSIQAVKESTRDVTNVTRMKNRFGDRFKILCGVDTLTFEELAAGADGLVAGLVCAFPKETVAIYNYIKAEKYKEALGIYRWFMPLLEFDIDPQLVQYIKLAEVYEGIGTEYVRAPRMPLAGERRARAIRTIEEALTNRPQL